MARRAYYVLHRGGVRRRINGLDLTLSAHIARGVPTVVTGPLLELWLEQCRTARLAIDVGANVGVWSALAARVMAPGGVVYALEPAPCAFEFLRDGARVHRGPGRIVPLQAAVSDTHGTVRFSVTDGAFATTNHIASAAGSGDIEVAARTLDSLDLVPQVIKIDVEGYELFALRGARETLARSDAVVLADLHWLPEFGMTPEAFLQLTSELGYGVWTPEGDPLDAPVAVRRVNSVVLRRPIGRG